MKFKFTDVKIANYPAGVGVWLKDEFGKDVTVAAMAVIGMFRQVPNDQSPLDVQVKKYKIGQKLCAEDLSAVELDSEEQTVIKNCCAFLGPLIAGQVAEFFNGSQHVVADIKKVK